MVFDPNIAKAENDRINALLMKEPEYEEIKAYVSDIFNLTSAILEYKREICLINDNVGTHQLRIDRIKEIIKEKLETLEGKTGFTKAPGLAHLMTVPSKFEVKDPDAVPAEFVKTKMTSSVDKVKLNKAIAAGFDTNVNWLEKIEGYKTVVIE